MMAGPLRNAYHSDTTSQSDKNQPLPQLRLIGQERPSQRQLDGLHVSRVYGRHNQGSTYHEERGYNPIDEYAEADLYPNLTRPENMMQALISNLA
jgi:SRSO17 transposase